MFNHLREQNLHFHKFRYFSFFLIHSYVKTNYIFIKNLYLPFLEVLTLDPLLLSFRSFLCLPIIGVKAFSKNHKDKSDFSFGLKYALLKIVYTFLSLKSPKFIILQNSDIKHLTFRFEIDRLLPTYT